MISNENQNFSVDKTIKDFKTEMSSLTNLTSLDNLAISLNEQFELHIINQTPDSEFVNDIGKKILACKKNINVRSKRLHNSLYMIFSYLLNSDEQQQKMTLMDKLYNFLKLMNLPDCENLRDGNLKDYLTELNSLQETLIDVQDLSTKLTDKNHN